MRRFVVKIFVLLSLASCATSDLNIRPDTASLNMEATQATAKMSALNDHIGTAALSGDQNASTNDEAPKWTDVVLAIFTILLTFSTMALWWETYKLRKGADGQTEGFKKSVEAAQRSAEAAERASHVERAWMYFDVIETSQLKDSTVDNKPGFNGFGLCARWTNGGRTPAIKAQAFIDHRILGREEALPIFTSSHSERFTATVGQSKTITTASHFIADKEMEDVRNKRKRLVFYSKVTYNDVFNLNIARVSEATFEVNFNGYQKLESGQSVPVFLSTCVGPNNKCE